MVNLSTQVNSLVLVLITLQVARNEAAKISHTVSSTALQDESSSSEKIPSPISDRGLEVKQEESSAPTELEARNQETRDTKYSYFYMGRWTWHIPLWFTLWFSFYVFWNVIRAILGHTINPDDYARRKREIQGVTRLEDWDDVNRITNFAFSSFEKFKAKNH